MRAPRKDWRDTLGKRERACLYVGEETRLGQQGELSMGAKRRGGSQGTREGRKSEGSQQPLSKINT